MPNLKNMGVGQQLLQSISSLSGAKVKHLANLPTPETVKEQKNLHSTTSKSTAQSLSKPPSKPQ